MTELPDDIKALLQSVPSKRALFVIQQISEKGFVTTEDINNAGYEHPPRAARDVRECGIPLETFRVQSSDGRSIAAYRFGDLSKIDQNKLEGRIVLSKILRDTLYQTGGGKCAICNAHFESRYFQIDHRIPYEVGGDWNSAERPPEEYMLLCGSCNRAKSWSCEHCVNWNGLKQVEICYHCSWAHPEHYNHVAMREMRRIEIVWDSGEVEVYERLASMADEVDLNLPDYVKRVLASLVSQRGWETRE